MAASVFTLVLSQKSYFENFGKFLEKIGWVSGLITCFAIKNTQLSSQMQSYKYMMNVCEQVELEERNEDILSLSSPVSWIVSACERKPDIIKRNSLNSSIFLLVLSKATTGGILQKKVLLEISKNS